MACGRRVAVQWCDSSQRAPVCGEEEYSAGSVGWRHSDGMTFELPVPLPTLFLAVS